jgi:hypothetical protein
MPRRRRSFLIVLHENTAPAPLTFPPRILIGVSAYSHHYIIQGNEPPFKRPEERSK